MPKFLAGAVMVPAKLVAYPVLAVVAVLHGLLFGFARIAIGVIRNFGAVLLLPFAPVSVMVRSESNSGTELIGIVGTAFMGFGLAIANVPNIAALFGNPITGDKFAMWLQSHNNIVFALTGTYLLSCLYEGGRAYCDYLTGSASSRQAGAKSGQSETMEAKVIAPLLSFLTMFSRIEEKDVILTGEADEITTDIMKLRQNGQLTAKEMRQLCKMVCSRETA